jgi:integrase
MTELNLAALRAAKPGDVLRDTKIKGFHARVFPQSRSFYLYYTTRGGKERRPKIGDFPKIGLDKAREIAKDWLQIVASGGDPKGGWDAEAAAPTVNQLCDRFIKWAEEKNSPAHAKMTVWYVDRFVRPRLGKLKAADVTHTHVEDLLGSLKKTPVQANRLRAVLSKMFNLAEKWGIRPQNSNPVRHVERYRENKRSRYMRPTEAAAIYTALERLAPRFPEGVAFIYLLIFTGARPSEIAGAARAQRQGNRFELQEHKTAGTGNVRIIYLPPQAVGVLDALLKRQDGKLFSIKSPRHVWRLVCKEAGVKALRIYDLRHSFASAALAAGAGLEEVGQLLGHSSAQTTKRYAHLMEEMGVTRSTNAADYLERMMKSAPLQADHNRPVNERVSDAGIHGNSDGRVKVA